MKETKLCATSAATLVSKPVSGFERYYFEHAAIKAGSKEKCQRDVTLL